MSYLCRRGSFLNVLVLVIAWPGVLAAQAVEANDAAIAEPAATDSVLLTLEEALEIAGRRSPMLEKARSAVNAAAAEELSGWGEFLPNLGAGLSLSGGESRVISAVNDAGQPFPLPRPQKFTNSSTRQGLSASLTLFDGFRRLNGLQAARAGTAAASAAVRLTKANVKAEVTRRFYSTLGAGGRVALEERLLASARDRLEAMRAMFPAGRATREDVLGAQIDVVRQRLSLKRARADARKRALLLSEAMGLSEDVAFQVVGEFPEPFDPDVLHADALVATAMRSSPRLRRAAAMAEQAEQRADASRGLRWPTVQMNASYSRSIGLPNYDALTIVSPDNQDYRFGLSASLPLFTGFETSARIAQAEAASVTAQADLRAERLAVERAVRSALIDLSSAYAGVQLADRVAELSRQRLEAAQKRFRLGAVPFFALQQFVAAAAAAERNTVGARVAYAQAVASLVEVVGREVAPTPAGQSDDPNGAQLNNKGT